jgi:hypothetical protein
MNFKKNLQIEYKNDEFYKKAIDLIGFNNPIIVGSYIKYGKSKTCDMDLSENINFDNINSRINFLKYVKKIISNEKKNNYKIIRLKFEYIKPYNKLKIIYEKLHSIDGLFNFDKTISSDIDNYINDLPLELKIDFEIIFDKYKKEQNIENYIILLNFLNTYMYPKWSKKECKIGKKIYYDEEFNILNLDLSYSYFYIEIIYDNFRISNYIFLSKEVKNDNDKLFIHIEDLILNNQLSYYYYLKKIGYFMKWLYFKKKLDYSDVKKNIIEFNNLFDFRDNIGSEYNKYCIIKNNIDLYEKKLYKYIKKYSKNKNKKYDKYIKKYNNKIKKLDKDYNNGLTIINNKSKTYFNNLLKMYEKYMLRYIEIK